MNFNQIALLLIEGRLRSHPTQEEILSNIILKAQAGKIAFYPCSRCSNAIVKLLLQVSPGTVAQIECIFDNSPDAFAEAGIDVYPLTELSRFNPSLAAVIVTANVFYTRETEIISRILGPTTPIINVSAIDLELAVIDRTELMAQIRKVVALLADEKSRSVYLLAWLARLLNDENLTELFNDDRE
ncbi:MAG: hypothetical protein WCI45_13090, partial [Desulfuromonadales bacterium]